MFVVIRELLRLKNCYLMVFSQLFLLFGASTLVGGQIVDLLLPGFQGRQLEVTILAQVRLFISPRVRFD